MQYYIQYGITWSQILGHMFDIIVGIPGFLFLGAVLGYKWHGRVKNIFYCFLGSFCFNLALFLWVDFELNKYLNDRNYIIRILMFFIFCLIFLKGKITIKAVASLLTFEVMLIAASLSTAIYGFVTKSPSMAAYNLAGYKLKVFLLFNNLILFLLYYLVLVILRKTKILESKSNYLGVSVLGFTTILLVFSTSLKENFYMSNALLTYIIIGIILINVVVYYFSYKRQKAEQAKIAIEQQYSFQKEHINDVNELHQKLRHVKHDMKNHIQCLASMINNDKKEEAINYLEGLSQEVSVNLSHTVVTDNDAVNYILDNKFETCRKLNIKYDYTVTGDNIKKVKDIDLTIILGNLLDNAIEACSKCDKKRIYLKISNEKAYLRIKIENTIAESVLEKNPKLVTNKLDGENHGLGIKSVESIVNRYNGLIDFYEQDGMFIFSVMLSVYNR